MLHPDSTDQTQAPQHKHAQHRPPHKHAQLKTRIAARGVQGRLHVACSYSKILRYIPQSQSFSFGEYVTGYEAYLRTYLLLSIAARHARSKRTKSSTAYSPASLLKFGIELFSCPSEAYSSTLGTSAGARACVSAVIPSSPTHEQFKLCQYLA